jgi:metallo-beta-lactamase superfamily protein
LQAAEPNTQLYHYQLLKGRSFADNQPKSLLLSQVAAAKTGPSVGSPIAISSATTTQVWTVIGIVRDCNGSVDSIGSAFTSIDDLHAFYVAALAQVHVPFHGSAGGRLASIVTFIRDGDVRVMVEPGMVPTPPAILDSLASLGESASTITDVVFSHHHPDHTLNAALSPNAHYHDHWPI